MERQRVNRVTDHECFGCGERNPIGLRLAFYRLDGAVEAEFTARPEHQGYIGYVHGGIIAALLDEAMSWAVIAATKRLMVTARMELSFRAPVPVGERLVIRGWVEEDRGRLVRARAELRKGGSEQRLAEASGTFLRVQPEQEQRWMDRYLGSSTETAE